MSSRLRVERPPLLRMETVLGAIDATAREAAVEARDFQVDAVRRRLPAKSQTLRNATRGRVVKTATGLRIDVAPQRRRYARSRVTALEVARFIEGGTGEYAGHGPIKPRTAEAFRLPGGWYAESVKGQPAQHPFRDAATQSEAAVERILIEGADKAAKAAERVLY